MSAINGVVIGLVTQVQPGQVKVNYPWLEETHETDWIRIATAMSGGERGTFLMPELRDEVLVAFDQGDPRMPYIIGFLWNGKDQPPGTDVRDRRITSRNGHSVRFLDATPSNGSVGALVIEDGHGNAIVMSNGKITIRAVNLLEIDALHLTLKGRVVADGPNPI
jgi:phage baseplate assembly protein gpV